VRITSDRHEVVSWGVALALALEVHMLPQYFTQVPYRYWIRIRYSDTPIYHWY
jgi:hypothetical protein